MTSKPTARERFEEIKSDIGVRLANDPLPKRWHDSRGILSAPLFNQDMYFLFSLAEAAFTKEESRESSNKQFPKIEMLTAKLKDTEDKLKHREALLDKYSGIEDKLFLCEQKLAQCQENTIRIQTRG